MTVEEAVAFIAAAFDYAETSARVSKENFRGCRKAIEAIRDARVIGGQEAQAEAGALDAMATEYEAALWAKHRAFTLRAQELLIDLPAPKSGGDR